MRFSGRLIEKCGGLLHQKPRNANLQQYPLVVSGISRAPRTRKDKCWIERDRGLTVTNTERYRTSGRSTVKGSTFECT